MSLSNVFSEKKMSKYSNYLIFIFFFTFLIIGISIFRSFGISIDEPFHRTSGYFWLYVIIKDLFFSSDYLIYLKNLLDGMEWSKDFFAGNYQTYGPIFDLLSAVLEQSVGINSDKDAFELKHLLTFLFFFVSGIYFFALLNQRYYNKLFSIFLVFIYFSSPRIFAESFYNSKDITFMSFCVFSIFHYFSSFKKNNFKHLIFFSLFAALATQIRIMGILLIIFYILFFFWDTLEDRKYLKKNYLSSLITIISYFTFLYIFWPFLWGNPISNLIETFFTFSNYNWGLKVFYLGNYINADDLPWHYALVWIIITTPITYIIFFFIGFFYVLKIFFKNINSLELSENNKLWNDENQKKDFFMIFFFLSPIISVILFSSTLYGGWRHLYFIYPSLIYLVGSGIYYFYFVIKRYIPLKIIIILFFLVFLHNSYNLIKYHPYQNIYFNSLIKNKASKYFEIDYWGLANHEAIEFIINDSNKDNLSSVTIRTASFTPLSYSTKILNIKSNNLIFQGTTHSNPQYIFTNLHYERNPKYQKKYMIPKNYKEVFSVKRAGIIINKVYKKE